MDYYINRALNSSLESNSFMEISSLKSKMVVYCFTYNTKPMIARNFIHFYFQ